MTALALLASFVLIVFGAIGFTNAVEWLGQRLDLGQGAVGALLAAVGTALPESVIPIVALASGGGSPEATEIAIGAIIGAPFLLGTLAMLLVAASALVFRRRRETGDTVTVDVRAARRDLHAFLILFPVAIVLGAIGVPLGVRIAASVALVAGYAVYVVRTVRGAGGADEDDDLDALYLDRTKKDPPSGVEMSVQFVLALVAIIVGAELFVGAVESIAEGLGVAPLVLALVLAPLATELPEKVNSVLWMREGKDTLALGNITGAMSFQATVPVVLGLLLTDWTLDRYAIVAACLGLVGGSLALWAVSAGRFGLAPSVVWGALFAGFVVYAGVG